MPIEERWVEVDGYKVWSKRIGALNGNDRYPVVLLHGGPGVPSDYLEPLERLAESGREVIVYDQLGCGRSDHPDDPALLQVERFVAELACVRRAWGLDSIHLYGQSWGGMLALEVALSGSQGVKSLILSNAPASMPLWVEETTRLRRELPREVQAVLDQHEQANTTDSPEYQEAMLVFYRRHVCRLDEWPSCLMRSFSAMEADPRIYHAMCGVSEFNITGSLRDWDVSSDLHLIKQPTLVISGEYDEATPKVAEALHRGIAESEWELMPDCSHLCHLEQTVAYRERVNTFLDGVEARHPVAL
jgi:proline-specific peptidase